MAPVTRRSAVSKTVHRKAPRPDGQHRQISRKETSDSWELLENSENNPQADMMITSAHHLIDDLNPLRDMADRVGREVENFAETLDKYNDRLRSADAFEAAFNLVVEYKNFAESIVKKLKKKHEAQRIRDMKKDMGARVPMSPGPSFGDSRNSFTTEGEMLQDERTNVETLKQWQAEADTWELMRIMFELRYHPDQQELQQQKEQRLQELGVPHRYTPENEIWERFTLKNDTAKERYLVLRWLEESADHGENDIDAIGEELEKKSGRGRGLWYNGWMETKERIKGDKRMRVFQPDSNSGLPNIKRSDNNELLVSALDPDAPTRQQRTLEKADSYSERSLWMICWEMLRRGKSWADVCEWCLERNQAWRAVAMGKSAEADFAVGLSGASYGGLWRRMCYAAAKNGAKDEYEAAVYGLLSGDLETVQAVCRTWDDHLYAHYNSLLLSQFDQYSQQYSPLKMSSDITKRFGLFNALQHHGSRGSVARNIVQNLRQQESVSLEARQPMKLLQSSLIANTVEDLLANVGTAISDAAWSEGESQVIAPIRKAVAPGSSGSLVETAIAEDYDALRIVTHFLIMLREFHIPHSEQEADILDNVIAAYVQFLRAAGTRDLAPLYASRMAPKRAVSSLAQVLSDITDAKEMMEFIKLIELYSIDPIAVLVEQYQFITKETLTERTSEDEPFKLVEESAEELYPGQSIKLDVHKENAGEAEQRIVDSLMAFYLIEGQWRVTFEALAFTCRKFLVNGYFAGAADLVRRFPFESISEQKGRVVMRKGFNVFDDEMIRSMPEESEERVQALLLQKQAKVYHELTQVVRAVSALISWRETEHEFASKVPRPTSAPSRLKSAIEHVRTAVEPLFNGILLRSKDGTFGIRRGIGAPLTLTSEAEAADLLQIRTIYLPEIILAYNSALCSAGHMISRDWLVSSMDLATVVADDRSGLGEAFVKAGRMGELVKSFAQVSKSMLKLNELGKKRLERKGRRGATLGVWEING